MAIGSNFDKTEEHLGSFAARAQEANRYGFIVLSIFRNTTTAIVMLVVVMLYSIYSGSFGYANVNHQNHLISASHELSKGLEDKQVQALAWNDAFMEGVFLMVVCSACIILFGILPTEGTPFEHASKFAVAFEVFFGIAGFIIDCYSRLGFSHVFVMLVFSQTLFRGAAPIFSHMIVSYMRNEHGDRIDAQFERWMKKIDEDYLMAD